MILIYEDTKDEYVTFLTPESSKALDDYLDQRRSDGEILSKDSPLFRSRYTIGGIKSRPSTTKSFQLTIIRSIRKANLRGNMKNGRYKTQAVHGFRKRFNTILKLNKNVNDNAIEKMLGHTNGLDGVDHNEEVERADFPAKLYAPWAKFFGYAARLALILQVCRNASNEANVEDVDEVSVAGAIKLINYFKNHAKRVYDPDAEQQHPAC